ncbi:Rdx family protein [Alicyclobacillus tolerans]|uniref:Selenoprotein W-related protein n=1 Tax=Alicyclobacillus tolerans TaxID=90970 RepID=A0A1M6N5V6_9BACL|nr:Rdx family protein [Alicyclobacillus montanus]SHJ91023.1 selenoprotein W-related protein [Alicyclobacillus montanus]
MADGVSLRIEYCTSCGFLSVAMRVAEELLNRYRSGIAKLVFVPHFGDGSFDVYLDDECIFSKHEQGRFPERMEICEILEPYIRLI